MDENNLDPESYRFLKELYRINDYIEINDPRIFNCLSKFIERNQSLSFDTPIKKPVLWRINDTGKTYVRKRKFSDKRWRIPIIISFLLSIMAIVISIIALLSLRW